MLYGWAFCVQECASDGNDTLDQATIVEALDKYKQNNPILHTVGKLTDSGNGVQTD
jgi:hypothetical protein